MPRRDLDHELIRRLLQAAGWTITHDPITLWFGRTPLYVDLGAEKDGRRIAVEIKGKSVEEMPEFERAIGHLVVYKTLLPLQIDLFLAVPQTAFGKLFGHEDGRHLARQEQIKLMVFESESGVFTQWIEQF